MKILHDPYRRDVLLIVLVALVLRLLALPWAQTVHADAVSRIHIAYEWMLDPHYISDGDWGPLHHYLNAIFMMIFPGKVLGPNILNILCASLTAIPLYGFALNLFGSRRGAMFTALLYVLSPIVIWTSLQALSEVPFGFFLALALFFLSEGIGSVGSYRNAILGGIFMTCAAALRYEAWVLIAVLTLVLLLQWNWRHTLVFWLCAMFFPATWMMGNLLEHGDALYSIARNDAWLAVEGLNDEVSSVVRVKRVVFFPWSFMINMSPIVLLLLLFAFGRAVIKGDLDQRQLIWLLPFIAMVFVFHYKAWAGTISLHHRFVVTWLILLLPFVPLILQEVGRPRLRNALMVTAVITLIPLAFFWNMIEYKRVLRDNVLGRAMDELALGHYREMQVIPRIRGKDTEQLLSRIDTWEPHGNGLILDFFGWERTYYIALHAPHHTIIVGGAKHEAYSPQEISDFLNDHPHGQVVFSRTGLLHSKSVIKDSILQFEGVEHRMTISEPDFYPGIRRLTYHVILDDTIGRVSPDATEQSLFADEPVAEFHEARIRSNEAWFSSVRRQAFWRFEPLDSSMRRNVEYILSKE